jgi:hypothetical protein
MKKAFLAFKQDDQCLKTFLLSITVGQMELE